VYIVNTVPGLLVKLSSPYWFDRVGYQIRMAIASLCMFLAFVVTSYFCQEGAGTMMDDESTRMVGQLSGVAIVSVQIGLGEASLLALAGKLDTADPQSSSGGDCTSSSDMDGLVTRRDSNHSHISSYRLLAFASGTGLAGPIGYLWKVGLTEWLGWSIARMLLAGVLLSLLYWSMFVKAMESGGTNAVGMLHQPIPSHDSEMDRTTSTSAGRHLEEQELVPFHRRRGNHDQTMAKVESETTSLANGHGSNDDTDDTSGLDDGTAPSNTILPRRRMADDENPAVSIPDMSARERFWLVLSLWPYIIPLFFVYAAEYACQAGAWTAIGFPTVDSVEARAEFYTQSNWLYQIASFVARSSGAFFTVSMWGLWLMPFLQVLNLIFFSVTAAKHGLFYRRGILLFWSLYTGLLGGSVYVQGYKRIIEDMPRAHTEFALSTTCVAEALGVLVADVAGLFLQSCLYKWNSVPGALVECPV